MKYITFVVPCYNSEAYMSNCIDSLLTVKDDAEIIIVNDGSKDNTGKIADDYHEKYPDVIKVVHKENGGHGSGINYGLSLAEGLYFKVVDSDDHLDKESLIKFISLIKENYQKKIDVDLYLTNFVYENKELNENYEMDYQKKFPSNRLFSWNDSKRFKTGQYIMMHALTYSLKVLKESKIVLPEKTFYVDNIFAFKPLKYVKNLYYLPIPLYRYFIGRSDQSVNLHNMAARYQQQLRVMNELCLAFTYEEINSLDKMQKKYLFHILGIYAFLTMCFVYAEYTKEKNEHYKLFLKNFKEKNKALYKRIYCQGQVFLVRLIPAPIRRVAVRIGYKIVCKITKWG